MGFCYSFLCNDAGLSSTAQMAFHSTLVVDSGAPHGWGLGYYQTGQPLLRKHPAPAAQHPLDFCERMSNLRTNVVLGHARDDATGGHSNENTQPFRFRNWLWCQLGGGGDFEQIRADVSETIPEFMRRNIHGSTDAELLFHLFLAFLNDTGRLEDAALSGAVAAQALRSALAYVDRLIANRGSSRAPYCCMLANGQIVLAVHSQIPLLISRKSAYLHVGRGVDDRPISYPHLKAVVLAGGREPPSSGWESVSPEAIVTVDEDLNIEYCDLNG